MYAKIIKIIAICNKYYLTTIDSIHIQFLAKQFIVKIMLYSSHVFMLNILTNHVLDLSKMAAFKI